MADNRKVLDEAPPAFDNRGDSERRTAEVGTWIDEKFFGFARDLWTGERVFIHGNRLADRDLRERVRAGTESVAGRKVSYVVGRDFQNRDFADDVKVVEP